MEYLKKHKEYALVPISMFLAGIYVNYNTKHIKRTLVDPGDGSPEVMEISEETATKMDYIYTSGAVGVFVFACIYIASKKSSFQPISQQSNSSQPNFQTQQSNPQLKPTFQPKPEIQKRTFGQIGEFFKTGPANF